MITTSDESWATDTLRDAQDPGAGKQSWPPVTRITLERYNLIFSQAHSRGYASDGQPQHDAATCLEDNKAILCKVALVGGDLKFTKWSVASGLEHDDVVIVADANISDSARPSVELTAGTQATIRVFYVDEDNDYIHYKESSDGGASFGAEANVGAQTNLQAIASVSPTRVHCVSYASGNSRFHYFGYDGSWSETSSLVYWPHKIEHIDAITIGDRDLVVFYSPGPKYGEYLEAGIYGIWVEHGRWSDIFKIDVLDEADSYAYRQHPMISTANEIYLLAGYLSEGDEDYSHATRFLKTSKDGQSWSQYMPLVTCPEAGPAKLLVVNAAAGESWPWDTGQQVYLAGYDKVYESDATRLVGEINTALQVNVKSRTRGWQLQRGVISQGNTVLSNHDGALDAHAIINADNTLLLKREVGYYTSEGDEYAQITLEAVDFIKETDELPHRHKQVVSRDFMAWVRDREADHFEWWESQLVGYDNYDDDTETGYGGLGHTATQAGWWETKNNVLWLRSNNEMGLAFATWDSKIMNGQVKAMIRVETSGNDEYAGVVFRAKDEDNFWAVYYNQATDKIVLRQRYGGSWLAVAAQSSAALGWSIDTWYGIMVDFRYSYIRVFRSTDGNTWTLDFSHVATPNALNPPNEYGYTGLLGYGYSSEDEEEEAGYEPVDPGDGPDDLGPAGPAVASHTISGYYFTKACGDEWEQRNTGLASTAILDLIWDPWWFTGERQGTNDPEQVIVWACGVGWVAKKVGASAWEDVTPSTDPPNTWADITPPTATTVTYKQLHGDIHRIDTFYALVEWQEVDSGLSKWRGWLAKTIDNGENWTWYDLGDVGTAFEDDFSGDALNLDKWDIVQQDAGTTITVGSGYVEFYRPFGGKTINLRTDDTFTNSGEIVIETRQMVWGTNTPSPPQYYAHSIYLDGATDSSVGFVNWALYESALYTSALYPPRTHAKVSGDGDVIANPPMSTWFVSRFRIPSGGKLAHRYDSDEEEVSTRYNGPASGKVGIYLWSPGGDESGQAYTRIDYIKVIGGITAPGEYRPLAFDVDTNGGLSLYITAWRDGTVYLQNFNSSSLVLLADTSICTATEEQIADKTCCVIPRAPHVPSDSGFANYVFVFGRWNDGSDRHLAYSSDGGVSFTHISPVDWNSNHRVGALDTFYDGLTIYAFINHATTPRLWKSPDWGATWSNVNSLPFSVEFEAQFRCNWSEDEEFLIGRNAAAAQMAAWLDKPYTDAWNNATGSPGLPTGAGSISAIIWI